MEAPKLLIRKGMVLIQGRNRPCIQVLAIIDPTLKALLEEHFMNENLFKRSSYATGFPAGVPTPTPSLAPHLNNFIKSDACPEITVRTILAGQLYQAQNVWEMKAFEYIAQRGFEALVDVLATVAELGREMTYITPEAKRLAEVAEAAAATAPAAIAPGSEGVANAA